MEQYANNWKRLNPDYEIKMYDNPMCEKFLLEEYGELHRDIFRFIRDGPIKADFWRVCILYKYGGVYSDIDNEPLVSLNRFIEPDIDFATCSSFWDEMKFNFNPNLIISHKNNPILKKCIDWYIRRYEKKQPYDYWVWSIMRAFSDVLRIDNFKKEDGIYTQDGMKIQIIKECCGTGHYDAHNIYKGVRVFNNRYASWNCHTHSFV